MNINCNIPSPEQQRRVVTEVLRSMTVRDNDR